MINKFDIHVLKHLKHKKSLKKAAVDLYTRKCKNVNREYLMKKKVGYIYSVVPSLLFVLS